MLFKARFMLTKIKNDINRYTVKCKNETCDWRFHASYLLNGLTFMIMNYEQTWPRAGSRYYFRHIIANFRATFENLNMTEKLWAASRVGDAAGFKEVMESINNDLVKSDHNTNNMSECFNSWIKDDRDKPILTLMESLRRKVMVRFHEK
ncbi:hypothetical protein ACOSP7_018985 [Xanthoceras sorbifolium]